MFCSPAEIELQQWQLEERNIAVNRALALTGRRNSKEVRKPTKSSAKRTRQPIYLKLAGEESLSSAMDSDSSYDSFNERVTGWCLTFFFLAKFLLSAAAFLTFPNKSQSYHNNHNNRKRVEKKETWMPFTRSERTYERNGFFFFTLCCACSCYATQRSVCRRTFVWYYL